MFDERVIAVGERMTAIVAIESRREAPDVYTLPYAPTVPVRVTSEEFNVRILKVVFCIRGMLLDG